MVQVRNRSLFILLLVAACLAPPVLASSSNRWLAQGGVDDPDAVESPDQVAPTGDPDETLPPPPEDTSPELSPSFSAPEQIPADSDLTITGSSSMEVITDTLVEQFQQTYPDASVTLAEQPADVALANLLAGEIDLAAIGRSLSDEQEAQGLTAVPVSREKIAIIVSEDNPFQGEIEAEDFVRIFRGEITNWVELGGPDVPIRFVDRPETSDTRAALADYEIFGGDLTTGENVARVSEDSTAEIVAALGDNGISYAIASQVIGQENVRVLGMHNTMPDDPRYPYSQPRNYVYRSADPLPPEAEAFLALATNAEGQELVAQAKAAEAADVAAADLADRINAVRPNGQGFVTGDRSGNIYFWNIDGTPAGDPVSAHVGPVTALAFSGDGQRLISGGADGTIRLWDAVGNPVGDPINAGNGPVTSLAVQPDASFVSASADGTIQQWDNMGNPVGAPITGHTDTVRDIALANDGTTLITASDDGTIRRWNTQDGTLIGEPLFGHQGAVRAVATKPDGSFFSGGADATVRYWNTDGVQVNEPVQVPGPVNAIAANAAANSVAIGDATGSLQYLSGEGIPVGPAITDVGTPIDDLAFSPDGERLIVTAGAEPQLRDSTGQVIPIPTTAAEGEEIGIEGIPPELADLWQRIQQLPPQLLWIIPVVVLGLLLLGLLRSFRQDEEALEEDEVVGILPEASPEPEPVLENGSVSGFTAEDFGSVDASLAKAKQTLAEGVSLGNSGRYQEALDRFNKAIELADLERLKAAAAGTSLAGATAVIARGLARRGTALINLGRTDEALSSLNRALEMDPDDLAAWIGKGNVLAQMGQLDEALFCFDKAIELNPNVAAAWQGKGRTLQKMGRDAEARKCFAEANSLGGVNEEIPIELGTPVSTPQPPADAFDSSYPMPPAGTAPSGSHRPATQPPISPGPLPPSATVPPDNDWSTSSGITPGPAMEPSPSITQPPQPSPSAPIGPIGIAPPEASIDPSGELPPDLLAAIESLPLGDDVGATSSQSEQPSASLANPPYKPMGSSSAGAPIGDRPIGPINPRPPVTDVVDDDPDIPQDVKEALEYLPDEAEAPDPNAPAEAPIAVPPEVQAILAGDSDIPAAEEKAETTVADPMAEFFGNDSAASMRPPAQTPPPATTERSPNPPGPAVVDAAARPDQPDEEIDPALAGLPPEVLEALRGIPEDSPDRFNLPPSTSSRQPPPPPPSNPRLKDS
jgi:ABC-type phosphate transport system substrate-binding protein/tetratricopeptide (TPR) repeat protein